MSQVLILLQFSTETKWTLEQLKTLTNLNESDLKKNLGILYDCLLLKSNDGQSVELNLEFTR